MASVTPALPIDPVIADPQRLAVLQRLQVLDTEPELKFDRFTRLAMQFLQVPVAAVSLIDADRQFFKSCFGLPEPWSTSRETPLSHSFCQHTVITREPLIVTDAREHPLVATNKAVADLGVIAYLGIPLILSDGNAVGAFCAIDTKPRQWTATDIATMHDLAAAVTTELELRLDVIARRAAETAWHTARDTLEEQVRERTTDLSTANQSLRAEVAARAQVEEALRRSEHSIRALYAIAAQHELDFDARLQALLAMGCQRFQVPYGIAVKIDEPNITVLAGHDLNEHSEPGTTLPLSATYCQYILQTRAPISFDLAAHSPWPPPDALKAHPIETYIGTPVFINGALYGVLSFWSDTARATAFTQQDIEVLQLMGRWVGGEIEQQQIEGALRTNATYKRAILNAIPDRMIQVAANGHCRTISAAMPPRPSWQWQEQEDGSGETLEILFPGVSDQMNILVQQAHLTGEMQHTEYQLSCDQQLCDYEARIVVAEGDEVVMIIRDITERKKVERLKDEFVAIVSHELRTPLTSIVGSLSLMAGGVAGMLPPQAHALIKIAHANSERLARLINDMLDIAKIEAGKMTLVCRPLIVAPLIERAIEANAGYGARFGVRFVFAPMARHLMVYVDADRLQQVLANLLSNAAKFSPSGSTVTVGLTSSANGVEISVADQGPGIPENIRASLFGKFVQADSSSTRASEGSGLGLSITKAIVEQLHGQIRFVANPNGGTIFLVDLPEWRQDSRLPR